MRARVLLLSLVALTVAAAYFNGLFEIVTSEESLRRALLEAGPRGAAWFVVLFAVFEGLGVPGMLFIFTACVVWPFPTALLLIHTGSVSAAIVGFVFARYVARDWVEARLPPKLRAIDDRFSRHALRSVLLLRLVFYAAPWTSWLLGLSSVPFVPFFVGTFIGFAPWSLFWAYAGRAGYEWLASQQQEVLLGLAAIALLFLVIRWLRRRPSGP